MAKSAFSTKFVAYGDSRDDMNTFTSITNKVGAENPEVVLHVGDCWGSASASSWLNAIKANSVTNGLLSANKYLVSRGNHESFSSLSALSPSVVRNNSEEYSFTQGNCFFVSCGMDPSANGGYAWLSQQLSSAASQAATWRFIFNHYPIYSSGSGHGADGTTSSGAAVTQYRSLCDQYHVTMCFAGHDHEYERSKLIFNGAAVGSGTTYNIKQTPGTIYVVTGGAGAPLYSVASKWWVGYNGGIYNYTIIDARKDTLLFTAKNNNGTIVDAVTIINPIANDVKEKIQNAEKNGPYGPGKNTFTIVSSVGARYMIVDVNGKVAVSGISTSAQMRLDLSGLMKGLYIVKWAARDRNALQKIVLVE